MYNTRSAFMGTDLPHIYVYDCWSESDFYVKRKTKRESSVLFNRYGLVGYVSEVFDIRVRRTPGSTNQVTTPHALTRYLRTQKYEDKVPVNLFVSFFFLWNLMQCHGLCI